MLQEKLVETTNTAITIIISTQRKDSDLLFCFSYEEATNMMTMTQIDFFLL